MGFLLAGKPIFFAGILPFVHPSFPVYPLFLSVNFQEKSVDQFGPDEMICILRHMIKFIFFCLY
jgi:hypothetical protein